MNKKLLIVTIAALYQNFAFCSEEMNLTDYDPVEQAKQELGYYSEKLSGESFREEKSDFVYKVAISNGWNIKDAHRISQRYLEPVIKYINGVQHDLEIYAELHGVDQNLPRNVLKEAIDNSVKLKNRSESAKTAQFLMNIYYGYLTK